MTKRQRSWAQIRVLVGRLLRGLHTVKWLFIYIGPKWNLLMMLIFLVFWILECRFFFSVLYSCLPGAVFTYHTMYWANWWVYIGQDDKVKKLLLHLVAIFNHLASHTVYLAFVSNHVAMWIKTHFENNDQVVHLEFWGDSMPSPVDITLRLQRTIVLGEETYSALTSRCYFYR